MIAETEKLRIKLHFSFAATVTLMLCFCDEAVVLTALSASLLHESGHLFFLTLFGCAPITVSLSAFGMRIDRPSHSRLSFKKEVAVALGGIFFNILGALLFTLCAIICKGNYFPYLVAVNLLVALMNASPNINLDLGRAIYYFLLGVTGVEKAERFMNILSVIFALLTVVFFVFYTLFSGFNISLAVVTIYILILTFKREVDK